MKCIRRIGFALFLTICLFAQSSMITHASYASSRVVLGTSSGNDLDVNEGGRDGRYFYVVGAGQWDDSGPCVWRVEYRLSQNPVDGSAVFSNEYLILGSYFGKIAGVTELRLSDRSSWPAEFSDNLNIIEHTPTTFIYEYTLTPTDILFANTAPYPTGSTAAYFAFTPRLCFTKLPDTVEAAYTTLQYRTWLSDGSATYDGGVMEHTYLVDKKTVEISSAVAPVDSTTGLAGTFNSNPNVLTKLVSDQEAEIQLTITRPVGVKDSEDIHIDGSIPSGMTYVPGSLSVSTDSGIALTSDDSTGTPVLDFTGLPVGKTVTMKYRIKAPNSTSEIYFNTNDTLINGFQQNLVGRNQQEFVVGNVYSQAEYETTVSLPLVLNYVEPPAPYVEPAVGRTCQDDGYPTGYYWSEVQQKCVIAGTSNASGYTIPNTSVE